VKINAFLVKILLKIFLFVIYFYYIYTTKQLNTYTTMKTQTIQRAKKLLEVFPSMHDLMNSKEMMFLIEHHVMHPLAYAGFRNDLEWEGIAIAVQNMCMSSQNRPFDDGYCFPGGKESGYANVYPAYGDPIKIDNLTVYKALLVCMFCSWMQVGVFSRDKNYHMKNKKADDAQQKAFYAFKDSDHIIYSILD
jgi:hypothetical protein